MSVGFLCITLRVKIQIISFCIICSISVMVGDFEMVRLTMEDVRHSEGGNIKLCFQKKGEKTKVWDVAPLALMSFL